MSSIAGPSSHAFSSFSIHHRQPSAISTQLRRLQDASDPNLSNVSGAQNPSTPVMTTASTTAPPTPIARSISTATDVRDMSVDPAVEGDGTTQNGTKEPKPTQETARDREANVVVDLDRVKSRTFALSKKHARSVDEEEAMEQTAVRIAARLAEDQCAALFPDVDSPFTDQVDVVNRLLPFHVFQQPREDIYALLQGGVLSSRKGKRKATEEDLLRQEIADTKFALECWKRKRALERRFRKARIESGKRASPADQGYVLVQALLEVERAENSSLNAELRSTRAELDKLDREKRAAAPPPSTPATKPTPTIRTSTSASYYSPSTTSTPTTATFMPPYRPPYSYTYSQYPSTQYTYNPYSTYTATSTPYSTATSAAPTTTYTPPASAVTATTATPTSAASAQVQQAQASPSSAISNTAIPVQLPVSSLPALAALGIIPVAAASIPPASQSQPPAVIKSTNGSMLNLEINLSLLQAAQMSGLVLILNALTSRGVNVDGTNGALTAMVNGASSAASATTSAPAASNVPLAYRAAAASSPSSSDSTTAASTSTT